MATNEESSMIISTEPDSTVPLDNNRVTAETVTGSSDILNVALLVEIQKLHSELIATTEESRKKQEEMLQKLESKTENKIETIKKEMSKKLQSLEALTSEVLKSNDDSEKSNVNLEHVFENVEELEENKTIFSGKEDIYNAKWCLYLKRECGHLGLYVRCDPNAPAETCSIRTKIEFKVLNRNQDVVIRTWECCYQRTEGWGFPSFLEWEDMKKWYLVDGNLRVEAIVTIIETTGLGKKKTRKFDESQNDVSDVILVVRDAKFYVLKMFLASQSSVFKALLLGSFSESTQSEVTLNGIDPDDFHYFLEVLYGESAIDDTTVEGVVLLADMYDAPTAIRRCEEFLLKESKKTSEKKLKIATRYNLEELKEKCL
ncbi:hypothetical protein B9Z55_007699 [Caenorhabditis nigoni]|uniref:BTB domain-containing protein n=1 Tax=Caenorhabditis nigoni TaxID=1611254 RepID=A0A2G5VAR9_9PELO|nr:hypothetical protein B9Z55_007699 [Caenorhabditis nigoni]